MEAVYRRRTPQKSALYKIIKDHYRNFKLLYPEKYQQKYGFFRTEIEKEINKYLECGIPQFGFARIKCQKQGCSEEKILPFSCKGRAMCPSCMQKHMLQQEMFLTEYVLKFIPHRHFVFAIPKLLRKNFYWHRESLSDLSRIAWKTVNEFMTRTMNKKGVPGSIQSIATSGEFQNLNPHIHSVVTDGIFINNNFHSMPRYDEGARIFIQSLWERNVSRYCISKGYVTKALIDKILCWRHTGFSVYTENKIHYSKYDKKEQEKMQHILRYITKPTFSLEKLVYQEGSKTVLYKGSYNKGIKRNFETYKPEDFIAAIASHIPMYRQKYTNYYGFYSNKSRGLVKKKTKKEELVNGIPVVEPTDSQKAYRRTWAVLIKKVFEVDPLKCDRCGSEMKIISIITDKQVIRKILEHTGIWKDQPGCTASSETTIQEGRAPPLIAEEKSLNEIEYVPFDDGWIHV